MSEAERIAALERRVEELEARLEQLEALHVEDLDDEPDGSKN